MSDGSDGITEWSDVDDEYVQAWPSLASRIPPELFDMILFFANALYVSRLFSEEGPTTLRRNSASPSSNDMLAGLKRCSLVCRFWADISRRYMFSGKTLEIRCREDADIFRELSVFGCPSLTPVHEYILHIKVVQGYEGRSSFLHQLYLPIIKDKLCDLTINGPAPKGLSPLWLSTPHWRVPLSMVLPTSFLRNRIRIQNIHFPSFSSAIRYILYFKSAAKADFGRLTWDGDSEGFYRRNPAPCSPRTSEPTTVALSCMQPRSKRILAWGCTDSRQLALTALMHNRQCPLHYLGFIEFSCMTELIASHWYNNAIDSHVYIRFDVSEQSTTMRLSNLLLKFEAKYPSRYEDRLCVAGICAYIDDNKLPMNMGTLLTQLENYTPHVQVRAIVLLFSSFKDLQEALLRESPQSLRSLLASVTTNRQPLFLAYVDDEKDRAVSFDPQVPDRGIVWEKLPGSDWGNSLYDIDTGVEWASAILRQLI